MSCKEWMPALLRAAEDRLDGADEAARFAAHLRGCAGCRQALADQKTARRLLAARVDAPVPAGFAARVLSAVQEAPGWMDLLSWRIWTYRLAPVAAALLLMAGLVARSTANQTPSAAGNVEEVVDIWTYGAAEGGELPAYALLGQDGVSGDRLLDAILSAAPDETLAPGGQS